MDSLVRWSQNCYQLKTENKQKQQQNVCVVAFIYQLDDILPLFGANHSRSGECPCSECQIFRMSISEFLFGLDFRFLMSETHVAAEHIKPNLDYLSAKDAAKSFN